MVSHNNVNTLHENNYTFFYRAYKANSKPFKTGYISVNFILVMKKIWIVRFHQ